MADGRELTADLERDIFVADRARCCGRFRFGSELVEIVSARGCAARASRVVSATATFASSAQQYQVIHDDFSHVSLLPGGFIVPGVGSQTSLDVDLPAFLQILARNFRGTSPRGNVVPLGAILPLAFFVLVTIVGG